MHGGTAQRYSHWNGYDLSTTIGTSSLMLAFAQAPARVYWFSPPCGPDSPIHNMNANRFTDDGRKEHEKKKSRAHRIQRNIEKLIEDILMTQPQAIIALEQPRNCRSMGKNGRFRRLRDQLHEVETSGCFWGMRDEATSLLMEKRWRIVTNSASLAHLLSGTTCTGGHVHQPIVGGVRVALTAAYPKPMCQAIARWNLKVPDLPPGFGQVLGATHEVSARELDAWRALPEGERQACTSLVAHLHRSMGHVNARTMVDALRREGAKDEVVAAAKLFECPACHRHSRLKLDPVSSGKLYEPGEHLGQDNFEWTHPQTKKRVLGVVSVDLGSRAITVRVLREAAPRAGAVDSVGNATGQMMKDMIKDWIEHYGRPAVLHTDPEGCFRERAFREWLREQKVEWQASPAGAHFRMGIVEKCVDIIKASATKSAQALPLDTDAEEILKNCAYAHNELSRTRGYSPWQMLLGRSPPGLGMPSDMLKGPVTSQEARDSRMAIREACFKEYISAELHLQSQRIATHRNRPYQIWSAGQRVWYWRDGRGGIRRAKGKGGSFAPGTVLLHERKLDENGDARHGGAVWIVDGDLLLRSHPHHLRSFTESESILDTVGKDEWKSYIDLIQKLPEGAFTDLLEHKGPQEDEFDEPLIDPVDAQASAGPRSGSQPMDVDGPPPGPAAEGPAEEDTSAWEAPAAQPEEEISPPSPEKDEAQIASETQAGPEHDPDLAEEFPGDNAYFKWFPEQETRAPPPAASSSQPAASSAGPAPVARRKTRARSAGAEPRPAPQKRQSEQKLETPASKEVKTAMAQYNDYADLLASFAPQMAGHHLRRPAAPVPPIPSSLRKPKPEKNHDKDMIYGMNAEKDDLLVEIEMEIPESQFDWIAAKPEQAFSAMIAKRKAEVKVSKLSAARRHELEEAKDAELANWLRYKVVEAAARQGVDPRSLMKMRWVVTTKEGTGALKARLVVQGFTDPRLGKIDTASPTCSRRARQWFLSAAASMGLQMHKGDVRQAFLQGDEEQNDILCEPVEELKKKLGLDRGQCVRLLKAVYGLVNAPRRWWERIRTDMKAAGWEELSTEACFWVLRDKDGSIAALAVAYVDDFMLALAPGSSRAKKAFDQLQKAYEWGIWETGNFTQCGAKIKQSYDKNTKEFGEVRLDYADYAETIFEIDMSAKRKKELDSPLTQSEHTQLRGVVGQLMWLGTQAVPQVLAGISLLLGATPPTVKVINEANRLVRQAVAWAQVPLKFHRHVEPTVVAWSDAGWGNRADGSSQGGHLVCITDAAFLQGEVAPITPISWHSGKLKRVARSSSAAEVQAAADAEEECAYVRLLVAETIGGPFPLKQWTETCALVPGVLILDARGVYDALSRSESTCLGLRDRRSGFEALALKRNMQATGCLLRWAHSDAQLADCLTKDSDKARMSYELLQQRGYTWKLIYDPKFTAARRRTAKGVSVLDDMPPDEAEENEEPDEVIDLDPDPAQKNPDLEKMIRTYMP